MSNINLGVEEKIENLMNKIRRLSRERCTRCNNVSIVAKRDDVKKMLEFYEGFTIGKDEKEIIYSGVKVILK